MGSSLDISHYLCTTGQFCETIAAGHANAPFVQANNLRIGATHNVLIIGLHTARSTVFLADFAQRDGIAHQSHSTIQIAAAMGIIDAVAITHIQAAQAAVLPNRVLNEAGKDGWKEWVELPGIDQLGGSLNNVGATAGPIAGYTISVLRVEPGQNARSMQKVVHQRIDRNLLPPISIQSTIFFGAPCID